MRERKSIILNFCVTSSCAGPSALLCRCSVSPQASGGALGTPGPGQGSVLGRVSTEQHSVLSRSLSRVTRPRHEYVTRQPSRREHKSVPDTTSGVFTTHYTSDMMQRKHNIDFGWPGVFASLQKSGCGVSRAETICTRLAAFSNGFSLVCAV